MDDNEIFENSKSRARDLLTCGLCGGTFFDPRRLPCDHSFCRRCLQAFHDSIRNEGSIRLGSFHCPACNAQIGIPRGGVGDFPVDERIGDIKEKVVGEMEDILRKKLQSRKGTPGSSFDSGDRESQNSNAFSQKGTGSHETDPPTHQGKSRTFGRYQTFTDFDARQKRFETSNTSAGRPRFDRHRPAYSSLRETHRRKAQDLMAAFNPQGLSQTDEFLSSNSTSREGYHNASSETRYPADRTSFNNSSRFKTHHTEDVPHRFSSRNSRSSFANSESATTGSATSFANASSDSGYLDDKNSTFIRNQRGYESLREKSSRRTYLGEDTFAHFAGKTPGESKFQETKHNLGNIYGHRSTQNDIGSVPLVETADRKTVSGHKSVSVSDPCLAHAKGDHADLENFGDMKFTDFKRPAETVAHAMSHDSVNDQNGDIFAGLKKKPPSGRTKLLGSFISSLATAHEEERGHFRTVGSRKMSSEDSPPSEEARNAPRHPADCTNTSTSNTPTDSISSSNCVKPGMNARPTSSETVGRITNVSGKVPSKNLNNSMNLEDEVEVMQEFDFLLSELNEEEEIDADSEQDDDSTPINSPINKRNLPQQHQEHPGKSFFSTTTPPPANTSQQCLHDTKVASAAIITDKLKNGFAGNGASNRSTGSTPPRNGVTVESRNGIEGSLFNSSDPLPSADRFGEGETAKKVASGETISSLHNEGNVKIHDDSNGAAADDDDEDDDDEDTLVNGKASEDEDNCFDQSPPVSASIMDDDNAETTATGKTHYLPRVNRRWKKTINKGTATLHHVSPEVYLMPTGVATLSQGTTVVADHGIGCLQFYASDGSPLHRIEGMKPFSIAVNLTNNQVIVGDRRRKTVCLYDEYGCDVAQWDANMFKWICGIGILSSGDLVILDREKSQIGIYKSNGLRLHTFGSYGNEDSQLCMAEFLVVDGKDRIVVSDSGNHCIKVFSVDGTLLEKFGRRGCKDGEMQWPKGVCTDDADNIIVADACNSRVSMFASDGSFRQHLVTNITMPYAVSYSSPNVAVTRYSVMGQSQFLLYSVGGDKS